MLHLNQCLSLVQSLFRRSSHRRELARRRKRTLYRSSWLVLAGESIRLDIGAGHTQRPAGWLTLDTNDHCDLFWDLADGIPFPDHSVSEIYSSHVFEHIPPDSLVGLLRDCYRALAPGGSVSVCVPDARFFLDAYSQRRFFVDQSNQRCWQPGWFETGSLIDQINYIAYMGGEHRLMFDDTNLTAFLRLAGFQRVALREFQEGLDLPQRHYESIYAIGYKPA
jgi:SAM-dependent methyltransferase